MSVAAPALRPASAELPTAAPAPKLSIMRSVIVTVRPRDEAVHAQVERPAAERRRHEQRADELAGGVAGEPQAAPGEPAGAERERQRAGVVRLRARALRAQRLEQEAERAAPQLRRRVEAVDALAGCGRRQQEPGGRARLGAVHVGLGGGEPAARSRDDDLVAAPLDGDAEAAQAGGERVRVAGLERPAQHRPAGREAGQQQRAVGDALGPRHAHDGVEAGACGADGARGAGGRDAHRPHDTAAARRRPPASYCSPPATYGRDGLDLAGRQLVGVAGHALAALLDPALDLRHVVLTGDARRGAAGAVRAVAAGAVVRVELGDLVGGTAGRGLRGGRLGRRGRLRGRRGRGRVVGGRAAAGGRRRRRAARRG